MFKIDRYIILMYLQRITFEFLLFFFIYLAPTGFLLIFESQECCVSNMHCICKPHFGNYSSSCKEGEEEEAIRLFPCEYLEQLGRSQSLLTSFQWLANASNTFRVRSTILERYIFSIIGICFEIPKYTYISTELFEKPVNF